MGEVSHKQSLRLIWRPVLALVTAMMVIDLGFCIKSQKLLSTGHVSEVIWSTSKVMSEAASMVFS